MDGRPLVLGAERGNERVPAPKVGGAEPAVLGCVYEIPPPIADALRVNEKGGWAGVALGGTGRWPASALVALAEPPFSLTLGRFIS